MSIFLHYLVLDVLAIGAGAFCVYLFTDWFD